jgi:putative tryptophan/tyrosine transport system substrate-binding protein
LNRRDLLILGSAAIGWPRAARPQQKAMRPGGNITGVSFTAGPLPMKRLELLCQMVPAAAVIAMVFNPKNANSASDPQLVQAAANTLGVSLLLMPAASDGDIEEVFVRIAEQRADGLLVNPDAFLTSRRERIAALAAQHRLPTIYSSRANVDAGGLVSYGGSFGEVLRLAGIYVARILDGAKPADLPVIQAAKTELVVNLKAATALGLKVPQSILARSDEVIE